MKTIRFRLTRLVTAMIAGSLCLILLVIKTSLMDSSEGAPALGELDARDGDDRGFADKMMHAGGVRNGEYPNARHKNEPDPLGRNGVEPFEENSRVRHPKAPPPPRIPNGLGEAANDKFIDPSAGFPHHKNPNRGPIVGHPNFEARDNVAVDLGDGKREYVMKNDVPVLDLKGNHMNNQENPNNFVRGDGHFMDNNYPRIGKPGQPKVAGGFLFEDGKKPYPNVVNGKFIAPARIVHLDLKGAAPRVPYLEQLFKLMSSLGANGVLIEWEEVFPFHGRLEPIKSSVAYSKEDVKAILSAAQAHGLEVIPLVQTLGHLEMVLKLEQFRGLREADRFPQSICPSNKLAVSLVWELIDQVMELHMATKPRFFHMGADEVFQLGMCDKCQRKISEQFGGIREKLMLEHIQAVAQYVDGKYKQRVLMWHDMLNNVETDLMLQYKLGELVEPVVWAYAESLDEYLMPDMWQRFASVFPYIWGASAYKGADGPSRYYSNVPHYLANHLSWLSQMTREYKQFTQFRGLIFTGWQRFDHFAILCEILPVGVPSMAINLLIIKHGEFRRSLAKEMSSLLECSGTFDVDSPGLGGYCKFPGAKIYQSVQQLRMTVQQLDENLYNDYQIHGWLSPFNQRHNYSQAFYLDQILDKISMYSGDLMSIASNLRIELSKIFFPDMVDEYMYTYVDPHVNKLQHLMNEAQRLGGLSVFPRREFSIEKLESIPSKKSSQNSYNLHNNQVQNF